MHPRSVLIDDGQHDGDEELLVKSIEGDTSFKGDAPVGALSVAIHPAATPGRDTPSYGPMPLPETGAPSDWFIKSSFAFGAVEDMETNSPPRTAATKTTRTNKVFCICI